MGEQRMESLQFSLDEERRRNERLSDDEQFWRNKRFEEMERSHFEIMDAIEAPPYKKQKIDQEFDRHSDVSMFPLFENFIDPSVSDYDVDFVGLDTQTQSKCEFDFFV